MRKTILFLTVLVLGCWLIFEPAGAQERKHRGTSISTYGERTISDGKVTIEGPSSQEWLAYLTIQAPNGAVLDLAGINGPVGVSDFTGNIQARNQNGPISFHGVSGQVRAEVQNGPITVSGSGGDFHLSAQNGPLTVELDGNQWSGGELEGSTQNGPLTLKLPDSYLSSVRVDASKHSPVECRGIQCQQAVRTW